METDLLARRFCTKSEKHQKFKGSFDGARKIVSFLFHNGIFLARRLKIRLGTPPLLILSEKSIESIVISGVMRI
jgi:hypothetical protein